MTTNTYDIDTHGYRYDLTYQYLFKDYPIWHDHDYWELPVVLYGEIKHYLNSDIYKMEKNTAFLIRPKDRHKLEKGMYSASMMNILMRDRFVRELCACFSDTMYDSLLAMPNIQLVLDDKQTSEIFNNLYLLKKSENDEKAYNFVQRIIGFMIFGKIAQLNLTDPGDKPRWLTSLLQQAHHWNSRKWKVQDLLQSSGYSEVHLCRAFKQYLNCTPVQYLTNIKMIHASDCLIFSDLSVIEIASELGFSSTSHFNHIFKEKYGVSPTKYRNQQKESKQLFYNQKDNPNN